MTIAFCTSPLTSHLTQSKCSPQKNEVRLTIIKRRVLSLLYIMCMPFSWLDYGTELKYK